MRVVGPALALSLLLAIGGISVWQAWNTADHLRSEARETSEIFGRVVAALTDTTDGSDTQALLRLVEDIARTGIPLIVTDELDRPVAARNLSPQRSLEDPAIRTAMDELAAYSAPIEVPGTGRIYFGRIPATRGLSVVPILQIAMLLIAIIVGVWAFRTGIDRDRDRLWVAMARESAHQLGTPLMSARAWIDRIDRSEPDTARIAEHLSADVERLDRVAQRFERIGRPARRDRVALGATAERVAAYFEPRLPKHDHRISITVECQSAGPTVLGDQVLVMWALESIVMNAIDALAGAGGTIKITVGATGRAARITVEDDGPGVSPSARGGIFDPGVTTKTGGWGIGLALARRIVEELHGGRLDLADSSAGAKFVAEFPLDDGATES